MRNEITLTVSRNKGETLRQKIEQYTMLCGVKPVTLVSGTFANFKSSKWHEVLSYSNTNFTIKTDNGMAIVYPGKVFNLRMGI